MNVDYQSADSIWHAHPSNHRLQPGGSEYTTRYQFVKRQIPANAKVLDLGCNCGQLARNLHEELGCEVVGVDIVRDFVQYCNEHQPGHFYHGDVSRVGDVLPVIQRHGPFNVVTALEVIEHPVDVDGLGDVLKLALFEDGQFIITTPHPDGVYGPQYMATHPHHVRLWTRETLEATFGPALVYADIYTIEGQLGHMGAVFGFYGGA